MTSDKSRMILHGFVGTWTGRRARRIGPTVSKSVPGSSPGALRSPGRRRVVRAEPGHAMCAVIGPTAAVRNDGAMPNCPGRSGGAGFSVARSPACPTSTGRGQSTSGESAPTRSPAGGVVVMRCACASGSGGGSSRPARISSVRRQGIRQRLYATSKCRPRSGGVRCRTLPPMRSERPRRKVEYPPSARVRVHRMNMTPRRRGAGRCAKHQVHFMAPYLFPRPRNQAFAGKNPRKGDESPPIPAPSGKNGLTLPLRLGRPSHVDLPSTRKCDEMIGRGCNAEVDSMVLQARKAQVQALKAAGA